MNLRQLETFYWIAQLGSFRAAAKRLNTTQSTVSMRIRQLETELDAQLFHRIKRRARLTEKGRGLIEFAEKAVLLLADIHGSFGRETLYSGTVKLGVSELIGFTWLPELVSLLNRKFPGLTVILDMDLTANMRRKFEAGDLDIVLIPGPFDLSGTERVYLGSVEYRWMASRRLITSEATLTASDLQAFPVVALAESSNLHAVVDNWFRQGRAKASRLDVCNSLAVAAALTSAGLGISLLPHEMDWPLRNTDLNVLKAEPRVEPVPYFAAYFTRGSLGMMRHVAELARQSSSFLQVGTTC